MHFLGRGEVSSLVGGNAVWNFASKPAFECPPCLPSETVYNIEAEIKPFLPLSCFWSEYFTTATEMKGGQCHWVTICSINMPLKLIL